MPIVSALTLFSLYLFSTLIVSISSHSLSLRLPASNDIPGITMHITIRFIGNCFSCLSPSLSFSVSCTFSLLSAPLSLSHPLLSPLNIWHPPSLSTLFSHSKSVSPVHPLFISLSHIYSCPVFLFCLLKRCGSPTLSPLSLFVSPILLPLNLFSLLSNTSLLSLLCYSLLPLPCFSLSSHGLSLCCLLCISLFSLYLPLFSSHSVTPSHSPLL